MNKKKIVFIRGLWSHPKAVDWIKSKLEEATNLEVELFDYHDELKLKITNEEYIDIVLTNFKKKYPDTNNIILYGHSHGGALSLLINEKYGVNKLILSNPCLKPFAFRRRILNMLKLFTKKMKIGQGYTAHFEIKFENELKLREKYFSDNFKFIQSFSRLIYVGRKASKLANKINKDILIIQGLKDEFVTVKSNLAFYKKIPLSEYDKEIKNISKQLYIIPDGEHAILEEKGIYPTIYKVIREFINK